MKRMYQHPVVKRIDFLYEEQVSAQSLPTFIRSESTPIETFDKCQVNIATCQLLYHAGMVCRLNQGTDFSLRPRP